VHTHTHTHIFFTSIPWYAYLYATVGCQQTSQKSLTWLCRFFFYILLHAGKHTSIAGGIEVAGGCTVCVIISVYLF